MFDFDPQDEIRELRTHTTKHFPHPTEEGVLVCISSQTILHAKTDSGFVDIETEMPSYVFPEGKELPSGSDLHEIMALPEWGTAEVSEDGQTVRVLDRDGVSVFKYVKPQVLPVGETPLHVYEDGVRIEPTDSLTVRKELVVAPAPAIDANAVESPALPTDMKTVIDALPTEQPLTETAPATDMKLQTLVPNPLAVPCSFEVVDGKLMMRLPEANTSPLSAFDDTDTSAADNKDCWLDKESPNATGAAVIGTDTWGILAESYGTERYAMLQFTLPSGSGSISRISLKLYAWNTFGGSGRRFDAYRTANDTWSEATATWNNNNTNRTGSIVHYFNTPAADGFVTLDLVGGSSSSPIAGLTWGSVVGIQIKPNTTGNAGWRGCDIYFKEYSDAAKRPYVEITYTPLTSAVSTYSLTI